MVLEHYGIPTAPFAVIYLDKHQDKVLTPNVIRSLTKTSKYAPTLLDPLSYPLFVKPLAEGSSKGIKEGNVIQNIDELCQVVEALRASATSTPAILVEKFLAGREFTVGILGTGDDAWVLGISEMAWRRHDGDFDDVDVDVKFTTEKSKANEDWDGLADEIPANREDPLVERACTVALRAWRALRCRDGGRVDIRFDGDSTDAVPNILEVSEAVQNRAPSIPEIFVVPEGVQPSYVAVAVTCFMFLCFCFSGVFASAQHKARLEDAPRHADQGLDWMLTTVQVNPLAGLRPEWSQLPIIAEHNGMSYETLFEHILRSALKRAPSRWRM